MGLILAALFPADLIHQRQHRTRVPAGAIVRREDLALQLRGRSRALRTTAVWVAIDLGHKTSDQPFGRGFSIWSDKAPRVVPPTWITLGSARMYKAKDPPR